MLFAIASPQPSRDIVILRDVSGLSKLKLIQSLELGENLNVSVLGSTIEHKALLQIKNSALLVDAPFPLHIREKLTVHVDQIYPSIVLRIITREGTNISKMNDFLKLYRSNPHSLKDMIDSIKSELGGDNLRDLGNYLSKKDIQDFLKIVNKIIVSKDNMKNSMFLKESIDTLGLMEERILMDALSDPTILKDKINNPTLKQILMKLSAEISPIVIASDHSDLNIQKISQFSSVIDHAVTVIETLQIVNILANEQDSLFILQVPFQFPSGVKTQEIFIEGEKEKSAHWLGMQCRIVLFLDMDVLGELVIDAGLREGILSGIIKCPDRSVCHFIQSLLPELYDALSALDYSTSAFECILDQNIHSWKYNYLLDHNLFNRNVIDVNV